MAARSYGGAGQKSDRASDRIAQTSASSGGVMTKESKKPISFDKVKAAVIISAAIVIAGTSVFGVSKLVGNAFDESNGAASPDEAASAFVAAIDSSDDAALCKYIPRAVRDDGFMADTMNLSELKKLDEEHDITLSNIVIDAISDISDRSASLESGLYSIYNKSVKISDAKRVAVTSDMSYELDDKDYETQVSFNLISIKVGSKWYIYTGQQLSEDLDSEDSDAVNILPAETDGSEPYDIISTYIKPVVKDVKELDFYDDARKDLEAGKLKIDNTEYVMPASYESMTDLFLLAEDMFTEDTRVIRSNYILKHLPIEFNKIDYSMTGFDISIGNITDADIDVTEGVVTTLYMGLPDEIYDYPDIYLPGNVTLGTDYDDIVKMYGNMDAYEENENLKLHPNCAVIYQADLNNKRNHVYFEFSYDNKLVAVQYHYFDLNDFLS